MAADLLATVTEALAEAAGVAKESFTVGYRTFEGEEIQHVEEMQQMDLAGLTDHCAFVLNHQESGGEFHTCHLSGCLDSQKTL